MSPWLASDGLSFTGLGAKAESAITPLFKRSLPELFEIGSRLLPLPIAADNIMPGRPRLSSQHRQDFMRRLAVIQRCYKRLDNTQRAVIGTCIAPRLQEVRFRNVPMAEFGGFVLVKAEVNSQLYLEKVLANCKSTGAL